MTIRDLHRAALGGLMAAGLLAAAGCGDKGTQVASTNQPPVVRLTEAPVDTSGTYYYAVRMNWVGNDPDGRVTHFLFATDPPDNDSSKAVWQRTARSDTTILFNSTQAFQGPGGWTGEDPHTFFIKAVDDRGAESVIAKRAFFSFTNAPSARVVSPAPKPLDRVFVTPAVRIAWDGEDVDGVFNKRPVRWKYTLISQESPLPLSVALASPDSVRKYYAPRNWAGWDSAEVVANIASPAETTFVQYTNLIPDKEYMFVVIGFDEAGAYSPVFSRDQNMLYFRVTFAGSNSPRITLFNDFFFYEYNTGSYDPNNAANQVKLEVPANETVTFNWFATANVGSAIRSYRWMLDGDPFDQRPREDQDQYDRWSTPSLNATSATIGPFPGSPDPHFFYVEATDINNLKSLGTIQFTAVAPSFEKALGVVKDTRLVADQRLTGSLCTAPPRGQWPTQAELDTFLFARGGFPWKCYPTGTISRPGLFAGFDFESLGTRNGKRDQTVALSRLGRYQNLIWITDTRGAFNTGDGTSVSPSSALRFMTGRNRYNTLAVYFRQGGRVWLTGGGGAAASIMEYDNIGNNSLPPAPSTTFSNRIVPPELTPGRMMYDLGKWQSEFKVTTARVNIARYLGRNDPVFQGIDPFYSTSSMPTAFNYHSLAAGDTFPPGRTVINGDFFYTSAALEYMSQDNLFFEDLDPGINEFLVSGIDTIYYATGTSLVPTADNPHNVCMTVYPARELVYQGIHPKHASFVVTGFDIWSYRRTQCQQLVDFVLKDLWGLTKGAASPAPMVVSRPTLERQPARPGEAPRATPGSVTDTRSLRRGSGPGRSPGE